MFVAGIDAHATYLVIAIVSNTGQLVAGPIRIKNTQEDRLDNLLQPYRPLEVVVETSPAWPWLFDRPSSVKTPSAGIVGDLFVSHGGIDVLDLTPAGRGTTMRDTSCPVGIRSRHLGHDPERPAPMGPVSGTSHESELRGESVIVVEPTKHWASHQLDRAFST